MPGGPLVLKFQRGLPHMRQFGERLRLLVIQGEDKGTCFVLLGDLIFLGREGAQISLKDTNISRKHAEISWVNDHYSIRDLGSSNGVIHNKQKTVQADLVPGDILVIGLTIIEVFSPGALKQTAPSRMIAPVKKVSPTKKEQENQETAKKTAKKKEVDKKRIIVYVLLFFIAYIAFFMEEEKVQTLRERPMISPPDEEEAKKKKPTKKDVQEAIAEYLPNYTSDTQQRKDAEVFFRSGVRELQNKNYRRAITAFETALTVDPTHDLAKIYLTSARKSMHEDLKSMAAAALRARKSLRYKEARMHYENILRYLEGFDTERSDEILSKTNQRQKKVYEEQKKMFNDAKEALEQMDKEEMKFK